MKIKVGEFVRLARNQGINKIIDEDDDGFLILDEMIADEYGDECFEISLQDVDSEITKHSFNITDLIEVGDILELKEGNSICYLGLRKNQITVNYPDLIESIKNKDCELLSILTHEQYEQNCYRIEN